MPTLPLDHEDPFAATMGVMLFPDNPERAESWCRGYIAEAVRDHVRRGKGTLGIDAQKYLLEPRTDLSGVRDRWIRGEAAGYVLQTLYAIWGYDPRLASYNHAEMIVSREAAQQEYRAGRSSLKSWRPEFISVVHLWAAWVMRGRQFFLNDSVGYDGYADFCYFVQEAEQLREWGQNTLPRRSKAEPFLPADMWHAPAGWRPPERQPGWPPTGAIPDICISPEQAALINLPGRPVKKK